MKCARKATWLSVIMAAALLVGAHAAAQANLLVNPGFEASGGSYDGWSTFGSGPNISTPDNDDIYHSGIASAKIYGEFTNCPDAPQFDVGGAFQAFTPTAGMEYEFSGYSFVSVADTIPGTDTCLGNRLIAKIVFFNSGGGEIASNEIVIGDWSTPRNEWIPFTVTAPAPTDAVNVQAMLLFLQPGCDTGSVFVDDTSFIEKAPTTEPNVLANPSFDTDLSGWTVFGNAYYDGRSFARRTPTGAAKLYGTFVEGSDSGMFQQFPADPGSIWKFDAYAMSTCVESPIQPGNVNVLVATLLFKDAAGDSVGSASTVLLDEFNDLGHWTKHTLMGEAPAGTDSIAAYILFVQPISTEQGAAWVDDVSLYDISSVGVSDDEVMTPMLYQNVPNPFNPRTKIAFELPRTEDVQVAIYNVAGREVRTLVSGVLSAGPHALTWDGRTNDGSRAASGTYWYQLRTAEGVSSRSMVLLK